MNLGLRSACPAGRLRCASCYDVGFSRLKGTSRIKTVPPPACAVPRARTSQLAAQCPVRRPALRQLMRVEVIQQWGDNGHEKLRASNFKEITRHGAGSTA